MIYRIKGLPGFTDKMKVGFFLFFLRVPSCNFVANFLVIFMVVTHESALSPENHKIKTLSVSSVSSVAKLIS